MGMNFAYNWAEIDPQTNMCIAVHSTSNPNWSEDMANIVRIPVNDENYILKYYINGNWYEDAEGTIPWQSELI